ncbi:MAG: tryptophan 2,3-dioxygenase [Actinomycetota bacterium]
MRDDELRSTTYSSYLRIHELLSLQTPRAGGPEHDELLFIVIHQTYELWFKTLLHEFARAGERLRAGASHDALATLGRIRTILKTLVGQVDILETMTPLQFGTFRDRLDAASGFQSAQFRELEVVLGRRDTTLLANFAQGSSEYDRLRDALGTPSIWHSALVYLAARNHAVPHDALHADPHSPYQPHDGVQDALLHAYRHDGEAALVLERFVDIDEGLQEWRYRHVKMVERTIGRRAGTGGSSGAEYLASTLFRPVFPDVWRVRDRF